jgi:hypothetical protein
MEDEDREKGSMRLTASHENGRNPETLAGIGSLTGDRLPAKTPPVPVLKYSADHLARSGK